MIDEFIDDNEKIEEEELKKMEELENNYREYQKYMKMIGNVLGEDSYLEDEK